MIAGGKRGPDQQGCGRDGGRRKDRKDIACTQDMLVKNALLVLLFVFCKRNGNEFRFKEK